MVISAEIFNGHKSGLPEMFLQFFARPAPHAEFISRDFLNALSLERMLFRDKQSPRLMLKPRHAAEGEMPARRLNGFLENRLLNLSPQGRVPLPNIEYEHTVWTQRIGK